MARAQSQVYTVFRPPEYTPEKLFETQKRLNKQTRLSLFTQALTALAHWEARAGVEHLVRQTIP